MKKLYLLILINTFFINTEAQTFDWAKREGFYAYDYGYGIGTDNAGNVYVAGKYEDTANFSGITLPCAGNHDIYLAKYTALGALSWIRTGGGLLGDYAHSMSTDGTNYVYIAGEIEGTGVISFPGSSITLTGHGNNDLFLAKYSLDGTLLWARSEGNWGDEKALGITQDNSGNLYITGFYTDSTNFEGTTIPGAGYRDMFIAKYDAGGNFLWMKHAGSAGREEGTSIKCDASGNVYVCGMYNDGADFSGTTLTTPLTSSGHYANGYLAKYSPSGSLAWVKSFGGDYDDVAYSLTVDNAGKVYVTGNFNAYATFGSFAIATVARADIFVAAFDPTTGNVLWVTQAGGVLDDIARGIGTDGTNLFITGQYGSTAAGSTAAFGSTSLTAADSSDIFIAGLSNTGTFTWAMTVGGIHDSVETLGYESGITVTAKPTGEVYVAGALLDGGIFGTTSYTKYGRTDAFIAKILQAGVAVPEINGVGDLRIYPNPSNGIFSLDVSKMRGQKLEMTVQNCLGQIIDKKTQNADALINVDLSAQKKGIYFVEIIAENEKIYREKIILQ